MTELKLFAAGSLRYVFEPLLNDFSLQQQIKIVTTFGPAGLLRQRIENGEKIDLFASANVGHPQQLLASGLARHTRNFTRNRLCIVMRNIPELTERSWQSALLDDKYILATSTPGCDPSGDYSLQLFDLIGESIPGAADRLRFKTYPLVGGPESEALPQNVLPSAYLITSGRADIFIGYGNHVPLLRQYKELRVIELPEQYQINIEYQLAIMQDASPIAGLLADFITSENGQRYFIAHGFGKL